jgi:acetyl-CoA carboxylase carboxyl transferase subunit alpha
MKGMEAGNLELYCLEHEKPIYDYIKSIEQLKKQNQGNPLYAIELRKLERRLEKLKDQVYKRLSAWERILICRHPRRPHASDYFENILENFIPLAGDRTFADDKSVIGGFATIGERKCVVIGQEKGSSTESRMEHNFGMLNPEGFRKGLRLMKLAEHFGLPIVTFIDTPGANPGLEAEERGQGWAIANNLFEMAKIASPIIVVIIGEGCSGGALGLAVGDKIAMLEHAYYSVISPEGCASILWKDATKKQQAAESLKLHPENLMKFGIIDDIIDEPRGGAHHDPDMVFRKVEEYIIENIDALKLLDRDDLVERRHAKFRKMGKVIE